LGQGGCIEGQRRARKIFCDGTLRKKNGPGPKYKGEKTSETMTSKVEPSRKRVRPTTAWEGQLCSSAENLLEEKTSGRVDRGGRDISVRNLVLENNWVRHTREGNMAGRGHLVWNLKRKRSRCVTRTRQKLDQNQLGLIVLRLLVELQGKGAGGKMEGF